MHTHKIFYIKEELKKNNIQPAIDYLSNAYDKNIFSIFKEQKLLLIPHKNVSDLFVIYEENIRRIMKDEQEKKIELQYLQFIQEFISSQKKLQEEIKELLQPLLNLSIRNFSVLLSLHFDKYLSQVFEIFNDSFQNKSKDVDIENRTRESEHAYHILKGRLSDGLFAVTNLLNIFSGGKEKPEKEIYSVINDEATFQKLMKAIYLSSNINSYQYALDKVSYLEWEVNKIEKDNQTLTYCFSISNMRLEKSRELGLKRMLSAKMIREKRRWLGDMLEEFSLKAFENAWDYYQNHNKLFISNNTEYIKAKESILKSLVFLDAEDELLVGFNSKDVKVASCYLTACTLFIYAFTANVFKKKFTNHLYKFTNPEIPLNEIKKNLSNIAIAGGENLIDYSDNFITTLPIVQHLDLFRKPFVRDEHGNVFAIEHIAQDNWVNWVRCFLMSGGEIANKIGKVWENYIAYVMQENSWKTVIATNLKKDGKIITDIDILAQNENLLLLIQIKVHYGTGVNLFDQWKYRKKLINAVKQVKIAEQYIKANSNMLLQFFSENELKKVNTIQPLVITNSHLFNGWHFEGVPIISTGALMQIFNGATVRFTTSKGDVISEKQYAQTKNLTTKEFIEFLFEPLDWRISGDFLDVQYHTEQYENTILKFPLLELKNANVRQETMQ